MNLNSKQIVKCSFKNYNYVARKAYFYAWVLLHEFMWVTRLATDKSFSYPIPPVLNIFSYFTLLWKVNTKINPK